MFGIHPRLVAGVIFVEQVMNVSWVDRALDVTFANYGFNTSVGIGQVKVETAEWIESVLKDSTSMYFLGQSFSKVFPSESKQDMINRLGDPKWNTMYVAANIAIILKRWAEAGFAIANRSDIVGTLYSTGIQEGGFEKKKPHGNPIPNQFGRLVKGFFIQKLQLTYSLLKGSTHPEYLAAPQPNARQFTGVRFLFQPITLQMA